MSQKFPIIVIIGVLLLSTSCVSKKKYLEMETGRLKAESLARQLDEENNQKAARIEALIADFETIKNELMENNAIKDQYIDSLNGEIFALQEQLDAQQESMRESSFTVDFEQQRLTEALKTKDKNIASLRSEVSALENEISLKNSALDQRNFEINRLKDEAEVLQGKLQTGDDRIAELQNQLQQAKTQTEKLQSQIEEKNASITRLENNVKLLKKEMGNN